MEGLSNDKKGPKVILTCFAGRRRNMEILLMYADELHSRGLIDQMHIWDFTRDATDGAWLAQTFQRSPYIATSGYTYHAAPGKVADGEEAEVLIRCKNNAHLLLTDSAKRVVAEVSLGAYDNACDFLRGDIQGMTLSAHGGPTCDPNRWRRVGVRASNDGSVSVRVDGETILSASVGREPRFPLNLSLAGWEESDEVLWRVKDDSAEGFAHPYARLFRVKNKSSWREYYQHYTRELYPEHVIIKSDDDIVFIDVDAFPEFIRQRVADKQPLLLFPNILNNGVCAMHQEKRGFVSRQLDHAPNDTLSERIWGDGRLCQSLHEYFVEDHDGWIRRSRSDMAVMGVGLGNRVSINFFAILSKDLYAFQMVGHDDERELTVDLSRRLNRKNAVSMNMTVSHLAFYRQRETGLDEARVLKLYRSLAAKVLSR